MRSALSLGALALAVALWAAAPAAGARPMPSPAPDPASATYQLDDRSVTLQHGQATLEGHHGPDRVSLAPPRAYGDFNQDGHTDVAVVLLYRTPTGHEFHLLAVLLGDSTGSGRATNLIALGDRLALDGLAASEGRIAVIARMPGQREVPVTRTFTVRGGLLRERRGLPELR